MTDPERTQERVTRWECRDNEMGHCNIERGTGPDTEYLIVGISHEGAEKIEAALTELEERAEVAERELAKEIGDAARAVKMVEDRAERELEATRAGAGKLEEATGGKPFGECSREELLEACRWFWMARDAARADAREARAAVQRQLAQQREQIAKACEEEGWHEAAHIARFAFREAAQIARDYKPEEESDG